jgi:hypothetical protein
MTDVRSHAQWLVIAYLAGDNDLDGPIVEDLKELEMVGSTPGVVEVLAQIDRASGWPHNFGGWTTTRRYHVVRELDPHRVGSQLLADLGEQNTANPANRHDLVDFGARHLPAGACALVIAGHGSGVEGPVPQWPWSGRPSERCSSHRRGSLGLAHDSTSEDWLDVADLARVAAAAYRALGRKLDVLGLDACLMAMVEVAFELRMHVRLLVGSEEVEPRDGWPYGAILADLTRRPTMTAHELGTTIVCRYLEFYERRGLEATQSAIALDRFGDLAEAVDVLAAALMASIRSLSALGQIHWAWLSSLRFNDDRYVDLLDLARQLHAVSTDTRIRRAAAAVVAVLSSRAGEEPLVASGHVGPRLASAHGLSIYFPGAAPVASHYHELAFARRTRWGNFLDAYLGAGR